MKKKKRDRTISKDVNSSSFFSIKQKDISKLEQARELILELKEEYNLSFDDINNLIENGLSVPVEIFNRNLTVLEALVKYLKERKNLSLRNISELIARDERNVWHIYDRADKKYPKNFVLNEIKYWIPVSIFSDTKLSALESVVVYLKEKISLTYSEIAILLERNDRTIWTVYHRAEKKNVKPK
ncbi:MAG: hypothetical protein KKH88_03440 [Nanoarchaeota archaeon]|nr:hypothetical protein [Nanoarchaeota archaeon]